MGRRRFFSGLGGEPEKLVDRLFDIAYFWRLAPDVVLNIPLAEALDFEQQALRIAKSMKET